MKTIKKILFVMLVTLTSMVYSQTSANFKVEHNPSSLNVKVHVVNTLDYNFYDSITNNRVVLDNIDNSIFHIIRGSQYSFFNTVNVNRNHIGDTVMTLTLNLNTINITDFRVSYSFLDRYGNIDYYAIKFITLDNLTFTNFLISDHYTPCYATVGPDVNKPTVFWESLSDNMISHYDIKRNGTTISTVPFSTGILSYTDLTNTESSNFVQEYTVVAVDSSNNERSGTVNTLHARNLSSVDGNVEMDWTTPTTANPISNFVIYEYRQLTSTTDTLIEIISLPSSVNQYTVQNPKSTSSYMVGVKNISCLGTAVKSTHSDILLSNKLKSTLAGIETISIDKTNDEIIGYFDLMGREIDSNSKNQVIITRYKSGRIEKHVR